MRKRSFINISIVSGGNIFNAGLGLIFIATAAKILSVEDFGKYALLTSLLVIISKVMDFGTNSFFVAHSLSGEENIVSKFLTLKTILLLITLPIAIATLRVFNLLTLQLLLLFISGLIGYFINYSLFAFFQKEEKFIQAVSINTLPAIIKGSCALFLLISKSNTNINTLFAIFTLSILTDLFFLLRIHHYLKTFKFNLRGVHSLLSNSLPAGLHQLVADGWSAIANSVAKAFGSFSDVGVFSLADKISSVFSLISLSIFTVLLPKNALRKKENRTYDLEETALISAIIGILAVVAILVAQVVLKQFFGSKFSTSAGILDLLIIASAVTSIHSFMRDYFFVEKITGNLLVFTIIRVSVFILISILLAPNLQTKGIAIASLVSAVATLLATLLAIGNRWRKTAQNPLFFTGNQI